MSDAPRDPPDDSDEPPGIGKRLTLAVLGLILLGVLTVAYSLHAFWWQAAL